MVIERRTAAFNWGWITGIQDTGVADSRVLPLTELHSAVIATKQTPGGSSASEEAP
jgi:hypothetical protein